MSKYKDPEPLTETDAEFLEAVAQRISKALYYATHGPIGIDGGVSPGLLHDDYDRLRTMAKQIRRNALLDALAELDSAVPA